MAWTIAVADPAGRQLRNLDKPTALRILNYMDERVAPLDNLRSASKDLTGPPGGLCRYRVGDYRAICDIQDHHSRVLTVQMGNRREVCQ